MENQTEQNAFKPTMPSPSEEQIGEPVNLVLDHEQ